jgi:HSP20 family protein
MLTFHPSESYVTRTPGQAGFLPPADVAVGENETLLAMDLPGLTSQDLDIEMLDGELIVRGERQRPALAEGSTWVQCERRFGSFERRVRLPEDTDPDAITASLDNGVLTLTVPRPEQSKPKTIRIAPRQRELESAAA